MTVASAVYAAAAGWRRRWYTSHPERRHQLARPVISVGNLRVGGSGKTPTVACLARLLLARGEHPVILSRGYGRRRRSGADVTIVSDGTRVLATLEVSGDEPLMLAQALEGVPVVVGASRYRSGRLAEERLGATVHILDDGFQHLRLERTVDLLLVSEDDLADKPLPAGRLREPLSAAAAADALLTTASRAAWARMQEALGVETIFSWSRRLGAHRWLTAPPAAPLAAGARVVAAAGIARPERFVSDLAAAGWRVAGEVFFPDHHPFVAADLSRLRQALQATDAAAIVTTEKDAVRLAALDLVGLQVAVVPVEATIDPAATFADWLTARLRR